MSLKISLSNSLFSPITEIKLSPASIFIFLPFKSWVQFTYFRNLGSKCAATNLVIPSNILLFPQ